MTHTVQTRVLTFCVAVLPAGIVFSLLTLFPLAALSQTPSFSAYSSVTLPAYNALALHGDLNDDGYEDLIAYQGGTVSEPAFSVYLSTGAGAYRGPVYTAPSGSNVAPVALADFNNDGNLDLIAQSGDLIAQAAATYLYIGKGDGTFRAPIAVASYSGSEAVADVNHDGKMDILIASGSDLRLLLGNGDGTFHTGPVTKDVLSGSILTGDFNGDGIIDVALATTSNAGTKLQVLLGDGEGHFTPTYSESSEDQLNLTAADVNGDGISDLIGTVVINEEYYGNLPQEFLNIYYGQSSGGMVPAQIQLNSGDEFPSAAGQIAVADFNGDGIPDIAVGEVSCTELNCNNPVWTMDVLSGEGNEEFATAIPVATLGYPPGNLFAFRGNRDTKADLVFTEQVSSNLTPVQFITLLNTTAGTFPTCAAPNAAVGIAQCSPTAGSTVSSPVNFAVGAAGDEPQRKIEVWVDRKKQVEQFADAFSNYAFLNASLPLAAGSHRVSVIAYGWDNSQQSKVSTLEVSASSCSTPSSDGVNICTPASGATVSSPVQVEAAAKVSGTIASTQLWIDGVKKYTSASGTLNTSIAVATGNHRFAVIAVNTTGQKWESAVDVTVN